MPAPDVAARRAAYRQLHQSGCFVLPNPWDIGTTRYLQHLGFKAVATTSAGFAFARGLPDAAVGCDQMLAHVRDIVEATDLPVNADFENGYAADLDELADNVRRCVDTGVAGLSIEDATGDPARPLYDVEVAAARVKAARTAIDATGSGVMLTARAECFLVGVDDLDEVLRRIKAYKAAGADCLYAPGLRLREQIAAVVAAAAPVPVNVLMPGALGFTRAELGALGVRRISVGSSLARVAWTAFMESAQQIAAEGRFDSFAATVPFVQINGFFRDDWDQRSRT